MARRTVATIRRPSPHDYEADPDTPRRCRRCNLPIGNEAHRTTAPGPHRGYLTPDRARALREDVDADERTEPRYRPDRE